MPSALGDSCYADEYDGGLEQAVEVDFSEDGSDISSSGPDSNIVSSESDDAEQREERSRVPVPLLDVYSVRFLDKDEKYVLPHIFGVIAIQGSCGSSIIFNRKIGEPRLVNSEGLVKRSAMSRGLRVDGDILIKSYIFAAKYLQRSNQPPGWLWRAKSHKCQYDKLLVTKINSGLGPIEVQYAVYREATEAIMDITLNCLIDDDKTTEFRATVKAWNTQITGAISYIFEEEDICVNLGKAKSAGLSLFLPRCAVVVPNKSFLFVHIDIYHGHVMFANKTIKFPASLDGEEVQTIFGTDGMVVVKVTWLKNDDPAKVQRWITGGERNSMQYQLCDSSFRPLKVPCRADPFMITLRHNYFEDATHTMEESEPHPMDSKYTRLELFSMRFVNHEKLDVSKIYGTFMIDVGSTKFVLYNRKLGDPPLIDSVGFVMLTAPRHGMVVAGSIEAFHYLFDLESMVRYERIMWWSGAWSLTGHPSGYLPFDQLLSRQVDSEFGPIELTFAAYKPGAEATLEVVLVNYEVECPIEVFGHIKVKNSVVYDPRAVSLLFKNEKGEEVTCISNHIIGGSISLPLLRRAVVVPLHSTMILDVFIYNCDRIFAYGELQFDAMPNGTAFKVLRDHDGDERIKVKVSWRYRSHEETIQYCW